MAIRGRRRVLILGSGFGGIYTLKNLLQSLRRDDDLEITMVSDENFFLFTPLLHTVAMGRIDTRHISYPVRRLKRREKFNFIQAVVESIDLRGRRVSTNQGALDFDYLVLGLGSVTDVSEISSTADNLFTLKTLNDSILIRNHIIGMFEQAVAEKDSERRKQLLTFVVSGGGYTGVQIVTELGEFVFRSLPKYYPTIDPRQARVILVEADQKIVAEMHPKAGIYTMQQLRNIGIEVRLESRVTAVNGDVMEINGSEQVSAETIIWAAGVVANPRITELDVEKDDVGRVVVNENLELPGFAGVYGVGDCAHFVDPRSGIIAPPRAHIAVRQGKIAARNILAEVRGKRKTPYRYSLRGEMLSLGAFTAVFRFDGLRLYGLPARFLWIMAYSALVLGDYTRARIVTDGLLGLVFGRDITRIKRP